MQRGVGALGFEGLSFAFETGPFGRRQRTVSARVYVNPCDDQVLQAQTRERSDGGGLSSALSGHLQCAGRDPEMGIAALRGSGKGEAQGA